SLRLLHRVPPLAEARHVCDSALVHLATIHYEEQGTLSIAVRRLTKALEQAAATAGDLLSRLSRLAYRCEQAIEEMDFKFLLDPERKVFTIGYNVTALRDRKSTR